MADRSNALALLQRGTIRTDRDEHVAVALQPGLAAHRVPVVGDDDGLVAYVGKNSLHATGPIRPNVPATADCAGDGAQNGAHFASVRSGFPFSTMYVASSAALPLPTFFTAWIVPYGMNSTSPALSVTGGLPSRAYSRYAFSDIHDLFAGMRVSSGN